MIDLESRNNFLTTTDKVNVSEMKRLGVGSNVGKEKIYFKTFYRPITCLASNKESYTTM